MSAAMKWVCSEIMMQKVARHRDLSGGVLASFGCHLQQPVWSGQKKYVVFAAKMLLLNLFVCVSEIDFLKNLRKTLYATIILNYTKHANAGAVCCQIQRQRCVFMV
jgi:hypothetical protein